MNSDVEGDEEQTLGVEVEVVEITYSVVEEEEDQTSGVEMTVTIMETIIGITTVAAPMTANGIITTITMANGEMIITVRAPQEISAMYQIPRQLSWIWRHIPRL